MDLPADTFNLNSLGDVSVSGLANGNVLVWNSDDLVDYYYDFLAIIY